MPQQKRSGGPTGRKPAAILVLSGGHALGAYQGGAFEAFQRHGWAADWVTGTSIGAINAAIIAGNEPEHALAKLREFWAAAAEPQDLGLAPPHGDWRRWYNVVSAVQTFAMGRHNLFRPRWWTELPVARPRSIYDRRPLLATLRRVIDFERLNRGPTRLTINAVDLERGEELFFDNRQEEITPAHLLASSAMPPDFEPVEIDGRQLGDGSLISNTPLDAVLREPRDEGTVCFVVDLYSRRGEIASESLLERRNDIVFASQTDQRIRAHQERFRLQRAIKSLAEQLPPDRRADPRIARLAAEGDSAGCVLLHLAYTSRYEESATKSYDYSRATLDERWAAGRDEMAVMLEAVAKTAAAPEAGFVVHDFPTPAAAA